VTAAAMRMAQLAAVPHQSPPISISLGSMCVKAAGADVAVRKATAAITAHNAAARGNQVAGLLER